MGVDSLSRIFGPTLTAGGLEQVGLLFYSFSTKFRGLSDSLYLFLS